jgi:predicted nucleic acid-binding protein
MTYVVLDTDVLSFLYDNRPEASKFEHHLQDARPALTFTSIGEMHFGARRKDWSDQRIRDLDRYLRQYRLLPFDHELPRLYARLRDHAVRTGHPLGQSPLTNDLWIAASAIHHRAPLLTGNTRHFANIPGLTVLN